jgi:hypothetical protein
MTALTVVLTPVESARLTDLEQVVDRGLQTFVEVGAALAEIRDSRLYRESHATFEEYCRGRWDLGRSHAYRLIDSAAVVSPIGDIEPPSNEAQARELVPLRDDPDALREVWSELRDRHGQQLTAAAVRGAVRDWLGAAGTASEEPVTDFDELWARWKAHPPRNGREALARLRWVTSGGFRASKRDQDAAEVSAGVQLGGVLWFEEEFLPRLYGRKGGKDFESFAKWMADSLAPHLHGPAFRLLAHYWRERVLEERVDDPAWAASARALAASHWRDGQRFADAADSKRFWTEISNRDGQAGGRAHNATTFSVGDPFGFLKASLGITDEKWAALESDVKADSEAAWAELEADAAAKQPGDDYEPPGGWKSVQKGRS